MRQYDDEQRSQVERIVGRDLDEDERQGQAAVEPRGPDPADDRRLPEVRRAAALDGARRRTSTPGSPASGAGWNDAYRALQAECDGDPELFARALARARPHAGASTDLNVLIAQHNDWYPVERDLPLNPRTGDYVRVGGRSYRRPVLGPEWVLEQFPPPRRRRRRGGRGPSPARVDAAISRQTRRSAMIAMSSVSSSANAASLGVGELDERLRAEPRGVGGDERRHPRLAEELAGAARLDEPVGAREQQRARSEGQLAHA